MKKAFCTKREITREQRTMDSASTYKFESEKREYIVEPVFKDEGAETLSTLLLNLMRLDAMG